MQILQIILSIVIIGLVVIQGKGVSLSNTVAGGMNSYRTKRGLELFVFILTLVVGIAFVGNSILILLNA
jgi:protein translocase SecG subunit